jgi:hypothetical protein
MRISVKKRVVLKCESHTVGSEKDYSTTSRGSDPEDNATRRLNALICFTQKDDYFQVGFNRNWFVVSRKRRKKG